MGAPKGQGGIYQECPFTNIDEIPSKGNTTAKMGVGDEPSGGGGMDELNVENPYGAADHKQVIRGRPRLFQPSGKPKSHEDYGD